MQDKQYWQQTIDLFKQASIDNQLDALFRLLLTYDELESVAIRVQIIKDLLAGQLNQRDLKEKLGTGIATITRGSNSLKNADPAFRQWLINQLDKKE